MNCLHLVFTLGWVAVARQATCSSDGSGPSCAQQEPRADDLSVLLQQGVPSVESTSVLQSTHKHETQLESAASMLSDILVGSISKSEVEIVLAHYDENIDWSEPYGNIRTIYCKGPKKKHPPGCRHLKNVGREGHTYLYHIVNNYDRLSKWTVFTQAQAPTNGYRGHRRGGGHALPGVPFDAYVLPESAGGLPREDGTAFIFTGAVHMPTLNHSLRLSYMSAARGPTLHQQSKCPKTELLDGWQQWWDLGWFKKFIGGRCKVPANKVAEAFNKYWQSNVKLPRQDHDIVFFTQGARFAASRERILQRPKAFYEALLQKLDTLDPCHNYFNEWIWYYLIGKPEKAPCNTDLVIDEANNKVQDEEMLLSELKRYRKMKLGEEFNESEVLLDKDLAEDDAILAEDDADAILAEDDAEA